MKRLMIVAIGLFAATTTGCLPGKWNGGGKLSSLVPGGEKATFTIVGNAKDTDGDGEADSVKGQLEFHDKAAGVSLHAEVTDGGDTGFAVGFIQPDGSLIFSDPGGGFTGTYVPQPKSLGPGGTFDATVFPFPANTGVPALVIINLHGGVFDGYSNLSPLLDGNLNYQP